MSIETIRDELKSFAEDECYKAQMSANVHEYLWRMIQSIDHDLEQE